MPTDTCTWPRHDKKGSTHRTIQTTLFDLVAAIEARRTSDDDPTPTAMLRHILHARRATFTNGRTRLRVIDDDAQLTGLVG